MKNKIWFYLDLRNEQIFKFTSSHSRSAFVENNSIKDADCYYIDTIGNQHNQFSI